MKIILLLKLALSRGKCQSRIGDMERTLAKETGEKIGDKVLLKGWVQARRDHGKLVFIDLRDRSGVVQVVGGEELGSVGTEDVIEVEGEVTDLWKYRDRGRIYFTFTYKDLKCDNSNSVHFNNGTK